MDIKDGIWWVKQSPVAKVRTMSSPAEGLMSSSGSVRSVTHAAEHEGVRGGVGSVWRRRAGEGFAVISGENGGAGGGGGDGSYLHTPYRRTQPPPPGDRQTEYRKEKTGTGGKNRRHNDKETERKGKTGVR